MAEQPTAEETKQRAARRFGQAAPTYDTQRPMRNASTHLLQAVALRQGQRTLDLACGTGHIAIPCAQRVAPTGTVTGIDLAPEMVQQCRQKALAAGDTNLDLDVGDAEKLDFPENSFDVVTCGLGIFFLPNQAAALKEWFRVLKPGGALHFSAWGAGNGEPHRSLMRARLDAYGLDGRGATTSPLPQPEQCRQVLEAAGFAGVTVTTAEAGFFFSDVDDYWNEIADGPAMVALAELPDARQRQFEAEHRAEVAALATPQGIWFSAPVNIASGRKP